MGATLIFLILLASTSAWAGSSYDWRSGNSYNWNTTPGGDTHVRGFNYNTGSMWNQTIKPDGSMRGMDADGNYWNYNSGTGTYFNYGTGQMCTGRGATRTCF